jgi:hypothetical protein
MGKDSAIFEPIAGRAVIKGVICTDAGTGGKAEADGKTYGGLQGGIGKHPGGWQAASGSMAGTDGRSKLSAGTEIISARLCRLYLPVVRSGTVRKRRVCR